MNCGDTIMRIHQKFILWKTLLRMGPVFAIVVSASGALAEETSVIPNPLAAKSFPCLIRDISLAAVEVAIPLAIITIIIAGVRFILAAVSGKADGITAARKMLLYAVIGTAIVVGSFAIATAAVQIFGGPEQTSCK